MEKFDYDSFLEREIDKLSDNGSELDTSFDNFDLLNVDTEGVELQVLQGIGENIKKFTYIIVEVSDIGSVSDINVNQYLLDMGFEFVRDSEHHLSGINNKWFCDKIYKKNVF